MELYEILDSVIIEMLLRNIWYPNFTWDDIIVHSSQKQSYNFDEIF